MAEGGQGGRSSDIPRAPLHNERYTMQYDEESKGVCMVMSWLGYGPECRQKRRDCYSEFARLMSTYLESIGLGNAIIAGSKSEGLTCFFENDTDCIIIIMHVICLEDYHTIQDIPDDTVVLMMDTKNTYAGHYRLILLPRERNNQIAMNIIEQALCEDGLGNALLSSDFFADILAEFIKRSGPSIPFTCGPFRQDRVWALRCHSTVLLNKWAERPRHWPPLDVVKKVISLGACLTPVGCKESPYKHVEWRMCFNAGETEIINSLTDTQLKMYVMLKMIVKDVLRPQHKEVTSYTLKNIIMWQAESYPHILFNERSLFYWLREGLCKLRTAIATQHLPYYMIPDRNLMKGCRLKPDQQSKWIAVITEMMDEGPRIILRLNKIRKAVIAYPEPLLWYSQIRIELEMLMLEGMVRGHLFLGEHNLVSGENTMATRIDNLVKTFNRLFSLPDNITNEVIARAIAIVETIAHNLNMSNCDAGMFMQIIGRVLS